MHRLRGKTNLRYFEKSKCQRISGFGMFNEGFPRNFKPSITEKKIFLVMLVQVILCQIFPNFSIKD